MRLPLLLLGTAATAAAQLVHTETFQVFTQVPDNNPTGLLDSRVLTTAIQTIGSVEVNLVFSGGWNGDLYAYLAHESGFAVLLNRVGRTAEDPDGSGSSGMNLTFRDDAPGGDVHTALFTVGLPAEGEFVPDGRIAHPTTVTDQSPRSAFLASFTGIEASGTWELFVADLGPGLRSNFREWTLTIHEAVIPEPSDLGILAGLATLTSVLLIRRKRI